MSVSIDMENAADVLFLCCQSAFLNFSFNSDDNVVKSPFMLELVILFVPDYKRIG